MDMVTTATAQRGNSMRISGNNIPRSYVNYTAYYVDGPWDLRKEPVTNNAPERVIVEVNDNIGPSPAQRGLWPNVHRHLYKLAYERISSHDHHEWAILIYVYECTTASDSR